MCILVIVLSTSVGRLEAAELKQQNLWLRQVVHDYLALVGRSIVGCGGR
jgi:hypothetical protein